MTAYIAPCSDAGTLHTTTHCQKLDRAVTVRAVTATDYPDRRWCRACRDRIDAATNGPPEAVPCPCGDGQAARTARPTPDRDRHGRPVRHYHYRHDCGLGGTLVTVDGDVTRRLGPVFDPGRYGQAREVMAGD